MYIMQPTRTKKTFCGCYMKYMRKLLSLSLQAGAKRVEKHICIERRRCFDFTDGKMSHFTLKTSVQHKKL